MFRKIQKIPLSYLKTLPIFSYHSQKLHYSPPSPSPQYSTPTSLKDAIQDFYNILPFRSPDEETSKYILKLLAQGELYVDILDFRKARKKYNEALRVSEQVFGSENTEIALSLHRLGDLEQIEGEFGKSLELYIRAMKILKRDLTGNSPFIASLNRSIGLWYKHTDENVKALSYLVNAAESWSSLEEYEKAVTSLEFALEIVDKEAKIQAGEKAKLFKLTGDIYTQLGKLDLAEENLSKALKFKLTKKQKGSGNGLGSVYILFGFLRLKQEKVEEAVDYLEKGMKMCDGKRDKDAVIMARAYATLGYLKEKDENYIKALEYYQCAYDSFDKILQVREDIRLAKVLSYMGNIYFYLNEAEKSLEYYEESARIAERTKTSDVSFLATLYNNLGTLYAGMLENKLAAQCYEKAVGYTEKLMEITDPLQLAFLHKKLGISYVNICKFENAKESLERALDIYIVKGEECNEETRVTQMLIEEVNKRTDDIQKLEISNQRV